MTKKKAIDRINKKGALLVFPIKNSRDPRSLWFEFFPRTQMRWEWDEYGDDRVSKLWVLMKELSETKQVVYSKWYQGRATFFSRELLQAMLAVYRHHSEDLLDGSSIPGKELYWVLESDSPLSTKELKKATDLQGKYNASNYNRGMKDLFSRFLIVGFGEVDDGFFPSLAVGATKHLYEDIWLASKELSQKEAEDIVDLYMPEGSKFRKYFDRVLKGLQT